MTDQPMTDQTDDLAPEEETETPVPAEEPQEADEKPQDDQDEETFPRSYVERLRAENKRYRERAADRDDLAKRLHVELVAKTGRLADPTDLEFVDEHLVDEEALSAAIDTLLERKPHLASRRPRGSVKQGAGGTAASSDLFAMLKAAAG